MKRVAILGKNGVLGSDLVRYFSSEYDVVSIDRENYSSYKGASFDFFINANGNSKRYWANEHPRDDFLASTDSVMHSLFDFTYGLYIYISSSDVYDVHDDLRSTRETHDIQPAKLSPYGFHKRLSELCVMRYASAYLILRSSMILGRTLKKGPFFDAIHGDPLYIQSTSHLQVISTQEVGKIIQFLYTNNIVNEIYNMGSTDAFQMHTLSDYIKRPVLYRPDAEQQLYHMNIHKLAKRYPLKNADAYVREFLEYYNQI